MSKFTFAFTKEKKQNFIPNGDKTRYVKITGCPIESVNGTYYQMDPITINDKKINLCFTNGVYLLEVMSLWTTDPAYLYELDNSLLIEKFHTIHDNGNESNVWYNSKTLKPILDMNIMRIGDWNHGFGNQ